jgi:arylsulfatase
MTAPASRAAPAVKVDGREVATLQIARTVPFLLPGDETFDVGSDTARR